MPNLPELTLPPIADLQRRVVAIEAELADLRTAVAMLHDAVNEMVGAMREEKR